MRAVRTKLFTTVFALTLTACGGDDGGSGQDTGSTGPATTGEDTTGNADVSVSVTGVESSSSATDPDTSSSGGEATTTGVDTTAGTTAEESGGTTEAVAFALFSDAFVEGGGIPGIHHVDGGNQSPPLRWEGAPAGTMSYAIFFHDMTLDFEHSAIWNISSELTELPQDVDHDAMPADVDGALQCRAWTNEFGYGGPGSPANFYTFTLYAIDIAEIPDTEIDQDSELVDVRDAFEARSLGSTTLTGQSTGPD